MLSWLAASRFVQESQDSCGWPSRARSGTLSSTGYTETEEQGKEQKDTGKNASDEEKSLVFG